MLLATNDSSQLVCQLAAFKDWVTHHLEQPRPCLERSWRTVEDATLLASMLWPPTTPEHVPGRGASTTSFVDPRMQSRGPCSY